jgi:hypothetical protein
MLKLLLPAVLAFSGLPCFAAPMASPPESADASPCSLSAATGGDIRVVTCTLPTGRGHRLVVRFRGGHDDTSASLTASLDGRPFDCDADSKTKLFGEDGDVELYCRIGTASDVVAKRRLVVTVLWSHAQYRDFALLAE